MAGTIIVGQTGNPAIDTLLEGVKWDTATLSYGFPTTASRWTDYAAGSEPFSGFTALNAAQQSATAAALASWARVANLNFSPMSEPAAVADLRFAGSSGVGTAHSYYPSGSDIGGDTWFGTRLSADAVWTPGAYDFFTAVHEIGHSLGLKHPHEAAQFGSAGVADAGLDVMELTVMSYRSFTGASLSTGITVQPGSFAKGPMLDDIAAIQKLYGANYATNAGDTLYSFTPGQGIIFETTWDGGGTDTYDLSAYTTAVTVNLMPGAWSTFSSAQLARLDQTNLATLARGNVANATLPDGDPRALIENAVAGAGNDAVTGNDGANTLTGNAGSDTMTGAGGADALFGNWGNDVLHGNAGADTLFGGQDGDFLFGAEEVDALYGNMAADQLYGGVGDDSLFGGQGDDLLFGEAGDDLLVGNLGIDTLFGAAGADRFVTGGEDVVGDFNAAEGDTILTAAAAPWTVGASDGNAVISLGGGGTVTLLGVAPGAVHAGFFVTG
ncbi:MAG TPA: M10 family metallopeptidase [Azospirillum sp.]|nr:M10 family metallopeptidase [Azospirillum sp.]